MKVQTRPLMPDVGVVSLVPENWNDTWQVRHHVLTRLARYFHVVWLSPAPGWREIVSGRRSRVEPPADAPPGFVVSAPEAWLPKLYRPRWLSDWTFDTRVRRARRILVGRGCKRIVLYLWRPEFDRATRSIPHDVSCYHIDDEYTFSRKEVPTPLREERLIREVDQVFIHSPALLDKKGHLNPQTAEIPNGVDFEAYARPLPEPEDLRRIPRPRIGYTGRLKRQLDWELIETLVQARPDWQFVLVGPAVPHLEVRQAMGRLGDRSNVHFLGGKPVHELAAYPWHFDVCVMPYQKDDYTKFIYPLKVHEYLAAGRPVVGTQIRSLERLTDVLDLVDGSEQWIAAIESVLAAGSEDTRRQVARQEVARRHDWDLLVSRIAGSIAERLGPAYVSKLPVAGEATESP